MSKKIIAVLGATGAQGGGLARAILNDKNSEFSVRALTRNSNSEKAKSLANLGAEVIHADIDDTESLKNAFKDAYGVYAVTFYWEHFSPEKEISEVAKIAEAAKDAKVKHVIWSTLEDTRKWIPLTDNLMPTLMGKFKVPHFDGKGESDHYFQDLNVPTTLMLTSFYWDNFIYFGMGPKKGTDGKFNITFPMDDKKLPGMAAIDIGKCAYGIFKSGDKFIGKKVAITGEKLTGEEMAATMTKVLGVDVVYNSITPDAYRSLGFPGADDLGNMFQFKRDFNEYFCNVRSIDFSKSLNPELQSFETFLKFNKDRIPLE